MFLERGLQGEPKANHAQSKKDYDGSPKASAKSFVARYHGKGVLTFADGHAEFVVGETIVTESNSFPFPPDDIIWTHSPDENPNKH